MKPENEDIKDKVYENSKIDQKSVKKETEESKVKSKQTENKEKQHKTSKTKIIVGGYNKYYQLGEISKNCVEGNNHVISPPLNSSLDSSSLLSYSVYYWHSVLITRNSSLFGIDINYDGRIFRYLMERDFLSIASPVFQSKTAVVSSSLQFQLFAFMLAHFTCFQKAAALVGSLSTALLK